MSWAIGGPQRRADESSVGARLAASTPVAYLKFEK